MKIALAVLLAAAVLAGLLWAANESGYVQIGGAGLSLPGDLPAGYGLPADYGLPGGFRPGAGYVIEVD